MLKIRYKLTTIMKKSIFGSLAIFLLVPKLSAAVLTLSGPGGEFLMNADTLSPVGTSIAIGYSEGLVIGAEEHTAIVGGTLLLGWESNIETVPGSPEYYLSNIEFGYAINGVWTQTVLSLVDVPGSGPVPEEIAESDLGFLRFSIVNASSLTFTVPTGAADRTLTFGMRAQVNNDLGVPNPTRGIAAESYGSADGFFYTPATLNILPSVVPEPSSGLLFLTAVIAGLSRRRRHSEAG